MAEDILDIFYPQVIKEKERVRNSYGESLATKKKELEEVLEDLLLDKETFERKNGGELLEREKRKTDLLIECVKNEIDKIVNDLYNYANY